MDTEFKTSTTVRVPKSDWNRIVRAHRELLDSTEDILERLGAYKSEFLEGLRQSRTEHRAKKSLRITSIFDIR